MKYNTGGFNNSETPSYVYEKNKFNSESQMWKAEIFWWSVTVEIHFLKKDKNYIKVDLQLSLHKNKV